MWFRRRQVRFSTFYVEAIAPSHCCLIYIASMSSSTFTLLHFINTGLFFWKTHINRSISFVCDLDLRCAVIDICLELHSYCLEPRRKPVRACARCPSPARESGVGALRGCLVQNKPTSRQPEMDIVRKTQIQPLIHQRS